jgi:protein-tyrosine phosphatase
METQIVQILRAPDYEQEILRAVELLNAGKLLVLPTETVYGVAGLLSQSDARATLHELRGSNASKPFTVHIARAADAKSYLGEVTELGRRMMRKLWPGPVGLIFEVPDERAKQVASNFDVPLEDMFDKNAIALRCPEHRVFFDVVSRINQPVALVAPGGANHRVADLPENILSRVEMVFDAGEPRFSKPSTLLRVRGDSYEMIRTGIYDQRIIDRLLKTTILFVCSGNTCRSPMAEVIARKFLADQLHVPVDELDKKQISVMSAGSFALPGAKATEPAIAAVREMGLDLSRHRSRPLTVELINQADVILTMGKAHARDVVAMVPSALDKVSTLDPDKDIEDPIGGDVSLYLDTAKELKMLIERRLAQVMSA